MSGCDKSLDRDTVLVMSDLRSSVSSSASSMVVSDVAEEADTKEEVDGVRFTTVPVLDMIIFVFSFAFGVWFVFSFCCLTRVGSY